MAILATTVLSNIQGRLLETVNSGASWSSGHWTADEVKGYLRRRFASFLRDSQVVTNRDVLVTSPESPRTVLPADWQLNVRVAWRKDTDDSSPAAYRELARSDSWEIDHLTPTDTYDPGARPSRYTTGEIPPPALEMYPPPAGPGAFEVMWVGLPTGWDPDTSNFSPLPDDFVYALEYGTMADMLSKAGRGQDLMRAGYCESRYQEGIQIAQLILTGQAG